MHIYICDIYIYMIYIYICTHIQKCVLLRKLGTRREALDVSVLQMALLLGGTTLVPILCWGLWLRSLV